MSGTSTFYRGNRKELGEDQKQFHILLSAQDRKKLAKLSFALRMSAADVVRTLIRGAKVKS